MSPVCSTATVEWRLVTSSLPRPTALIIEKALQQFLDDARIKGTATVTSFCHQPGEAIPIKTLAACGIDTSPNPAIGECDQHYHGWWGMVQPLASGCKVYTMGQHNGFVKGRQGLHVYMRARVL